MCPKKHDYLILFNIVCLWLVVQVKKNIKMLALKQKRCIRIIYKASYNCSYWASISFIKNPTSCWSYFTTEISMIFLLLEFAMNFFLLDCHFIPFTVVEIHLILPTFQSISNKNAFKYWVKQHMLERLENFVCNKLFCYTCSRL